MSITYSSASLWLCFIVQFIYGSSILKNWNTTSAKRIPSSLLLQLHILVPPYQNMWHILVSSSPVSSKICTLDQNEDIWVLKVTTVTCKRSCSSSRWVCIRRALDERSNLLLVYIIDGGDDELCAHGELFVVACCCCRRRSSGGHASVLLQGLCSL